MIVLSTCPLPVLDDCPWTLECSGRLIGTQTPTVQNGLMQN